VIKNLSAWQPGVSHPECTGVYQRRGLPYNTIYYSFWSGTHWGLLAFTITRAKRLGKHPTRYGDLEWRGVLD
jgi:hypothetical protein